MLIVMTLETTHVKTRSSSRNSNSRLEKEISQNVPHTDLRQYKKDLRDRSGPAMDRPCPEQELDRSMANQYNVIWSIERRQCRTTPKPDFKVTPLFNAKYLRNGTRYGHSCNKIIH